MELTSKREVIHDVKDCKDKEEVYIYEACKKVSLIYKELLKEVIEDDSVDNNAALNIFTSFIITNFNREVLHLIVATIPIAKHDEFINFMLEDLRNKLMESRKLLVE